MLHTVPTLAPHQSLTGGVREAQVPGSAGEVCSSVQGWSNQPFGVFCVKVRYFFCCLFLFFRETFPSSEGFAGVPAGC